MLVEERVSPTSRLIAQKSQPFQREPRYGSHRRTSAAKEVAMARTPNYSFERQERERLKAKKAEQKAAEKAAAKAAEAPAKPPTDDQ